MTLGELVKRYYTEHGISQRQFATMCGIDNSYVSMLVNGRNNKTGRPLTPSLKKFEQIASGMGMGIEELFELIDDAPKELPKPRRQNIRFISGNSIQHHKIPLIGVVAGGQPIYDEEIDLYIDGPHKAYCAVRLKGDSMEPTYKDGDIIYVTEKPDVRDGQVAIVILDDEACLKRVYHIPNGLQLLSDNPKYAPFTATTDDYNTIRIIGIPCGYTRMYDKDTDISRLFR